MSVALAVLGTFVACGDDGDDAADADDGTATTDAAPATDAEPELSGSVTLMVLAPLSDPASGISNYPEIVTGAEAAAEEVNAASGLNGARIEIEACDTRVDPNEAVNCAQRAVDDSMLAVVSAFDNAGNYTDTLANGGIPNVAPYASPPVLADANSYPIWGGQLVNFFGGLTVLAPLDITSIAVPYLDEGTLGAQLEGLAGLFNAEYPDIELNFIPVSPNQGDYSSTVTTADQSDAILLAMPDQQIVQFRQTASQLGVEKPTSVPSATVQGDALAQLGDLAEGLYTVASFRSATSQSTDAVQQFNDAMDAVDPDAYRTDLSSNAYVAVHLVIDTLEGEDEMTPSVLVEKLESLTGYETGLLPPIQFEEPLAMFGESLTRVFNADVLHGQMEDGELVAEGDFVNVLTGE